MRRLLPLLLALAACSKGAARGDPVARGRAELAKAAAAMRDLRPCVEKLQELQTQYEAATKAGDAARADQIERDAEPVGRKRQAAESQLTKALDAALAAAEDALRRRTADADGLALRAAVRAIKDELDPAEADADALLKIRPAEPRALALKSHVLRQRGRYAEARRVLAPALSPRPDATALAEDGAAALSLGDFTAAAERLEAAAKRGDAEFPIALEIDGLLASARRYLGWWKTESAVREAEAKAGDLPRVKLETSKGVIVVELFENEAPNTVANFVDLAEKQFYDGTTFHRVIPNFMAQGGDPNSKDNDPKNDGQGGPGYRIADELPEGKYRRHFRGSLSMAIHGPDTGGSQFFIAHRPAEHLDGRHTVFGRVVEGFDVLDALVQGDTLMHAVVLRKRDHPYRPTLKD